MPLKSTSIQQEPDRRVQGLLETARAHHDATYLIKAGTRAAPSEVHVGYLGQNILQVAECPSLQVGEGDHADRARGAVDGTVTGIRS